MVGKELMREVRINVKSHGGTLYISSEDVPEFHLWGRDPDHLFKSIIPVLERLCSHNYGEAVEVQEAEASRLERWSGHERIPHIFRIYRASTRRSRTTPNGGQAVE